MEQTKKEAARAILKTTLPLAAGAAFLFTIYLRFYSGLIPTSDSPLWPAYVGYLVLSIAIWSLLEHRVGLVERCIDSRSFGECVRAFLRVDSLALIIVSSVAFFWRDYSFSRLTVLTFWTLHAALSVAIAWGIRAWAHREQKGGVTCVFLGGEAEMLDRIRKERPCGDSVQTSLFRNARALLAAVERFEAPDGCREVLIVVRSQDASWLGELARAAERQPVPTSVAVEGLAFGGVEQTASFVVFSNEPQGSRVLDYVLLKRLIDVAASATALVVLSPAMAVLAFATWLRSGGPVLLAQERVGRAGRHFRLYKFRTLPVSALASSKTEWSAAAIGGWGGFLRRTGLDELPQLWNVLRGDMSLVGPRPERPYFVNQFRHQLPLYLTRHRLEAGITGWAQVNGWRGDTSIPRRIEYDLYYLRHWSLAFDARILWMTARKFLGSLTGSAVTAAGARDARSL